jgi:hypothetical protein
VNQDDLDHFAEGNAGRQLAVGRKRGDSLVIIDNLGRIAGPQVPQLGCSLLDRWIDHHSAPLDLPDAQAAILSKANAMPPQCAPPYGLCRPTFHVGLI